MLQEGLSPARPLTYREMRFHQFASVEYNNMPYMTPQDFLESVTEEYPRRKFYFFFGLYFIKVLENFIIHGFIQFQYTCTLVTTLLYLHARQNSVIPKITEVGHLGQHRIF